MTLTRWNHWVTKGLILLSFLAVVFAFVTIYPLSDRVYVMVRIGLFLFMVAICSWLRGWMKKRKVNQSVSALVIVAVGMVCAAGILSWELGWEKSVWKEKLDPQPVDEDERSDPQIPKGTGIDTGAGSGISGSIYTGGQQVGERKQLSRHYIDSSVGKAAEGRFKHPDVLSGKLR